MMPHLPYRLIHSLGGLTASLVIFDAIYLTTPVLGFTKFHPTGVTKDARLHYKPSEGSHLLKCFGELHNIM